MNIAEHISLVIFVRKKRGGEKERKSLFPNDSQHRRVNQVKFRSQEFSPISHGSNLKFEEPGFNSDIPI